MPWSVPRRTLLSCLLLALQLPFASAQHQRFGVAPQTFILEGKGKARIAEAFCLDKHLFSSNSFVPYSHVINAESHATVRVGNAAPISLETAVERGIIAIEGSSVRRIDGKTIERDRARSIYGDWAEDLADHNRSDFGVRFKSNVALPVTIQLKEPTAFGEQEGDLIANDSALLAPLKQKRPLSRASTAPRSSSPIKTAAELQDEVWIGQESERILAELDYLHEPVNPAQIGLALTKFQAGRGLTGNGTLDAATASELKKQEKEILDELASIGFPVTDDSSKRSKVVAAADSLEWFSQYHGLPVSGVYTDALKTQVKKDAAVRDQLRQIASRTGAPDNILPSAAFADVVTFFRTKSGLMALCKSDGKLDSWNIDGDTVKRLGTGPEGLKNFEAWYENHALKQTNSQIAVLPAGYSGNFNSDLAQIYVNEFLSENGDGDAANVAGKKKILLAVSPLLQGRSSAELAKEDAWTKSAGNPLLFAKELQDSIRNKADVFVTNDALLGVENLSNLPAFSAPNDLAIYVDGKLADRGVVDTLFGAIDKTKIQVVAADKASPGQARVSLMVGENDSNFRELVLKMADQGVFKGGVLALAKCGEGGELAFNGEIIHRSQARAVIFYDELINIQAVKDVLYEFTKELRKNGIPDGDFRTVWLKSVDRAAANATGDYKDQILKLQNVHVQVRDMEPPIPKMSESANA